MKCPDCEKELIDVATSCRCGWVKGGNAFRPHVQCDHPGCETSALCLVEGKRYCVDHYVDHFRRKVASA